MIAVVHCQTTGQMQTIESWCKEHKYKFYANYLAMYVSYWRV